MLRTRSVGAGLFARKTPQAGPKVSSSLAAVRTLFEKAEENQRGNRDSLQLASLLTDSDQAAQDPSATGLPYGRYHPISMLLIRQALLPYAPSWMGVRSPLLPPLASPWMALRCMSQHLCRVVAHTASSTQSPWPSTAHRCTSAPLRRAPVASSSMWPSRHGEALRGARGCHAGDCTVYPGPCLQLAAVHRVRRCIVEGDAQVVPR